MRLKDKEVLTVWKCPECHETCEVDVTWFQDNGTPTCKCGLDMKYDHTYLNLEYDGTKCPKCGSEEINGDSAETEGPDKFFRNCDCDSCGATWTEEAVVIGYEHLTKEGEDEEA